MEVCLETEESDVSREFKLDAVRLCEETKQPVAEIARQLGIHPNNLYKWRAQFAEDGEESFPGNGHVRTSDEELPRPSDS